MWNLLLAVLFMAQTTSASAPPPPAAAAAAAAGDPLHVYVVTMGPGDEPYEKFGHNMLRITDNSKSPDDPWHDVAYNCGVFAFEKGFIINFLQGRLRYWMEPVRAQPAIDYYENELDRSVWSQELNLSPQQKRALSDFCQWNSLEDNKFYMYDYFRDNCSTRVRDAIDQATGGQIKQQATTMPSDLTFRSETRRLTADSWWLYVALDYALGHPTDQKLTAWDEMFIPLRMRDRLNQLKILDETGHEMPLVKNEQLLHTSSRGSVRASEPNRLGWFVAIGLGFGVAIAACGIAIARNARGGTAQAKWKRITIVSLFLLFSLFWLLLSVLGGTFLAYAWCFTDHAAVRPNENLLQLGPWMIPMLVLVPLALRPKWKRSGRLAVGIACFAAAASVLGLILKILPMMDQSNWNIIALALPINVGLAIGLWKLTQTREDEKLKGAST